MSRPHLHAAIVGGQKCGTTTLYRALARHPDVYAPSAKESRAFTLEPAERDRALAALYPPTTSLCLHAYAHAWSQLPTLASMHEHNPRMRLVALYRDPVERVWSAYHFAVRNGWEILPIHDALDAEKDRATGSRIERVELQYCRNSDYARLIRNVRHVFTGKQLLMVRTEDLDDTVPKSVLAHLGLDNVSLPPTTRQNTAGQARLPSLNRFLLGESLPKRVVRHIVPPTVKSAFHERVSAPLLAWNVVQTPLPPIPDDVRARLDAWAVTLKGVGKKR